MVPPLYPIIPTTAKNLRILLVVTKGEVGGAQQRVYDLARAYQKKDHEVVVGFGENENLQLLLQGEGIAFHRFKHLKRSRSPLSMLLYIREMKKFLDLNNFDIVHFNSSNTLAGALGAKRAKNKPKTVFTFRGLSMLDPNSGKKNHQKFVYWSYFKFYLRYIDAAVFQCERNLRDAKRMFLVKDGEVIYPGIEEIKFLERGDARKKLASILKRDLNNIYLIGSIGRLSYQKHYDFLINVFPEVLKMKPDAHLCIIGEGKERRKLEYLINDHRLQNMVSLPGTIANAAEYLKAFDLFVLTTRFEGISVALTETIQAGIPILASNVGGNFEVLGGHNSSIFRSNDERSFLRKFENLMAQEEKKDRLDERFTLAESSKKYLLLYKKLMILNTI